MNILAFDTAAEVLSVALRTDSGVLESTDTSGYRHSERLVPFIQRLLGEAGMSFGDLSLIVCSRGPGSFTGLRIGAATAKGISLGLGVPIVSVPTLDAYAWPFRPFPGTVVPLIDAKKRRFYTAFYRAGVRESEYLDAAPQDILSLLPADERVRFTDRFGLTRRASEDRHFPFPVRSPALRRQRHGSPDFGSRAVREGGPGSG